MKQLMQQVDALQQNMRTQQIALNREAAMHNEPVRQRRARVAEVAAVHAQRRKVMEQRHKKIREELAREKTNEAALAKNAAEEPAAQLREAVEAAATAKHRAMLVGKRASEAMEKAREDMEKMKEKMGFYRREKRARSESVNSTESVISRESVDLE